jgi:hypothetical protein
VNSVVRGYRESGESPEIAANCSTRMRESNPESF